MANVSRRAAEKLRVFLLSPSGISENIAAMTELEGIALPDLPPERVQLAAAPPEVADKVSGGRYPSVNIYCEKYTNQLREKFRVFSGTAQLCAEVRYSQDRLEGLTERLEVFSDAITRVLDQRRGDWGDGMFFTGGYVAEFGPVKQGGRNFVQSAKVRFEVEISI